MDSIADLLPFAVVIGYLFLKFAGRSRRIEAPKPPPTYSTARPGGRGSSTPSPFEELLARMEAAKTAPRPGLLPGSPPVPPPVVTPPARALRAESAMARESRKAVADYEARTAAASRFQTDDAGRGFDAETAGYGHERHGFGAQNPLAEPAFEAARDAGRQPANPARQGYDPHGLRPAPAPAASSSIAQRLASPAALRDAFVIQTVLARRPALRRSGGRRPDGQR